MIKIPTEYNLARDIDRYAEESNRIAIRWENEHGEKRVLTYRQLREESNRFANALKGLGCKKGDTVLVMLPRTPETYIVYLGALKSGLAISPGSELLRPKDLLYRMQHSKAKVVVCYHTLLDRIDAIRNEDHELTHYISVGEEADGWTEIGRFTRKINPLNLKLSLPDPMISPF